MKKYQNAYFFNICLRELLIRLFYTALWSWRRAPEEASIINHKNDYSSGSYGPLSFGHGHIHLELKTNPFHTAKAVLRGKFIVIQAYLKKAETFQINNLTLHPQDLEEQQQRQPRASIRKEITKIRAELNETKRTILRINKSRTSVFEKINKINKLLTRLIKKKRGPK